jgi:DNA-binding HxlR family transcriptional regulator
MTDPSPIRRSPVSRDDCNLAKAFELFGDRWTLLILRSALYGLRRFDDFHADLDVPRTVLSKRLAALVDNGVMERREYREAGQRTRVEYPLTKMGFGLGLPFMAMTAWADKARRWHFAFDVAVEIDGPEVIGCACRRARRARTKIGHRADHQ